MKDCKSTIIHLSWTIAVLVLAGAALISYQPTGAVIRDYLSFASAISSILLAVVAIFYSMISNQSFSETIGSLKSSSGSSEEAARNLNEASQKILGLSESISGELSLLSPKFDQISRQLASKFSPEQESPASSETGENKNEKKDVKRTSTSGLTVALYIVLKSFKTNKSFNPNVNFDGPWRDYVIGCLTTLSAFEVRDLDLRKAADADFITISLGRISEETILRLVSEDKSIVDKVKVIDEYFDGPGKQEADDTSTS